MKRYLEYDKITGRIVSELFATPEQIARHDATTTGIMEVPDVLQLDTNACIVRDGQIIRAYETTEERRERERLRREAAEKSRKRIRELAWEFLIAMIEADESRVADLRAEYAHLRSFL